ncbi:MAG: hypothetical protein WAN86_19470 [Hyphomicrobiaceae bacterium]
MDIVVWIAWALFSVLGLVWWVVWFLISGWVSTLLQIAVLIATVFFLKYGWQRAPAELWKRTRSLGLFVWGWVRARDPQGTATREVVRETVRIVRVKEPGDINISTLLSLLMVAGLALLATLP